jgi:hypothetical protein
VFGENAMKEDPRDLLTRESIEATCVERRAFYRVVSGTLS